MSPEQALGKPVDTRTDLFSFGILLYEMCAGRSPFWGDTTGELLVAIVQQAPVSPARLNPDVPPGLARIIDRCLEKDRALRYQHAAEIRTDLKSLQRTSPDSIDASSRERNEEPLKSASLDVRTFESAARGDEKFQPRTVPPQPAKPASPRRWFLILSGLLVVAAGLLALLTRPAPEPKASNYVQLTHDGHPKNLVGTDGLRLYLGAFGDRDNASLGIMQISTSGGEPERLRVESDTLLPLDVSPDGAKILAEEIPRVGDSGQLFTLPILGGSPHRLGDLVGRDAAWSPDGRMLVYADGSELYLAKSNGSESRKLVSLTGRGFYPAWSPAGDSLRFTVIDYKTVAASLWEVSAQGTNLHPMFPGWHNPTNECCGKWTADGKYFVFQSKGQIWTLSGKGSLLHRSAGKPVQLTSSPLGLFSPLPSKDGKKLFVVGRSYRGELERGEPRSGQFKPFLSGISAEEVAFSKDGQWVAYISYPEGILWRSNIDGSNKVQITSPPLLPEMPRWSPDGKQIAFFDSAVGKPERIYVVSAEGGNPMQLLPEDPEPQRDPDWSQDGTKILFGGVTNDKNSAIRVLDLKTHHISTLPGSGGLFSPRWSPDDRYVVAAPTDLQSLMLFDSQTQKWSQLLKVRAAFLSWSKDGQYVYFLRFEVNPAALRVRIVDGTVEQVFDLTNLPITGNIGPWLGLDPNDHVLVLKDTGTQDIYALDWEEP